MTLSGNGMRKKNEKHCILNLWKKRPNKHPFPFFFVTLDEIQLKVLKNVCLDFTQEKKTMQEKLLMLKHTDVVHIKTWKKCGTDKKGSILSCLKEKGKKTAMNRKEMVLERNYSNYEKT